MGLLPGAGRGPAFGAPRGRLGAGLRRALCSRGVPARVPDLHPGPAPGPAQDRHGQPGQGERAPGARRCSRRGSRSRRAASCPAPRGTRVSSPAGLPRCARAPRVPLSRGVRSLKSSPRARAPSLLCPLGGSRDVSIPGGHGAQMRVSGAGRAGAAAAQLPSSTAWCRQLRVPRAGSGGTWHGSSPPVPRVPAGAALARLRQRWGGTGWGFSPLTCPCPAPSTWKCCGRTRTGQRSVLPCSGRWDRPGSLTCTRG